MYLCMIIMYINFSFYFQKGEREGEWGFMFVVIGFLEKYLEFQGDKSLIFVIEIIGMC